MLQISASHTAISDTAIFNALNPSHGVEPSALILIIDDDPTARLALGAMMFRDGYRVAFSAGAFEVRRRLADINPDIIICDLVMEDMRGDEFVHWLKADAAWNLVPVIAVTQLDNPIVRTDLLNAGADIVLAKNTAPREFRAHVAAVLRTRRMYLRLTKG